MGSCRVQRLLDTDCDVEVLEDIFDVIANELLALQGQGGHSDDRSSDLPSVADSSPAGAGLNWLSALVDITGFEFNVRFFDPILKERIRAFLENCEDSGALELCNRFS